MCKPANKKVERLEKGQGGKEEKETSRSKKCMHAADRAGKNYGQKGLEGKQSCNHLGLALPLAKHLRLSCEKPYEST